MFRAVVRNARFARSARTARRASQCSAASIKQAAIHGATVSRLRVIAGPARFELRSKTEGKRSNRDGERQRKKVKSKEEQEEEEAVEESKIEGEEKQR